MFTSLRALRRHLMTSTDPIALITGQGFERAYPTPKPAAPSK